MLFLKKDEEIEMIKAINGLLDQQVPYVRRNYTKVRTIIREEPIKLAQYIRGKTYHFTSNFLFFALARV